jgi:hypothetical protein
VQTGFRRDIRHPMTLYPQSNDFVMSRRACAQDALPEFATLGFLAGAALRAIAQRPGRYVFQRLLMLHGSPMLLVAVGEPSPGNPAKKSFKLPAPGKMPCTIANTSNQVGENGLDDID